MTCRRSNLTAALILVLLPWILPVQAAAPKHPAPLYPLAPEYAPITAPVTPPVVPQSPISAETDLLGDTTTLGMTWYETQHNGSMGRMNTLEPDGWRQFVWMRGENSGASIRHVWWAAIDPNGVMVAGPVENSIRGGFVTLDVGSTGSGFPGYSYITSQIPSGYPWPVVSMDLIPHTGTFLDYITPPNLPLQSMSNTVIQIGHNQRLHLLAASQGSFAGSPNRVWYLSGTYNPTTLTITYSPPWQPVDWTQTIASDLAVSPVAGNNKVLWAWTRSRQYTVPETSMTYSQLDNDIYFLTDSDGLNPNFNNKVNLTQFIPPDLSYLPDTLMADRDTLRAYNDLSCLIDYNNYAHIVFTTRSYFALEGTTYWNASLIWHWSEQYPDSFRVVGDESYFGYNNNVNCGAWNVKAQRPTLGEASTGNLYCVYQVFDTDTTRLTAAGFPSGEIYASVSTDGGLHWSQAVNLTSTLTPNQAVPGQSWSEMPPTLAKKVDNYLHIEYVLDKDAGNVVQTEGSWTNNPVRYHRVPVALIPTTPLLVQTKRLHVLTVGPSLIVTVAPINPPIVIPAQGGSFQFNASILSNFTPQLPLTVWCRIKNPDGTYTPPTLGPVVINPPPGQTISRQRTQNVPGSWPAGVYTYLGYANFTYSYPAADSSFFTFTKSATATAGLWMAEASCTGEPFPGEPSQMAFIPSGLDLGISPNPFNPTTAISYQLQATSQVKLTVWDTAGRLVTTLVEGKQEAGTYQVSFDGAQLATGVYLACLKIGDRTESVKLLLLK